jgi:AcrR family transcriptional regulator
MTDLLSHGRTRQKQRTRDALLAAARAFTAEGRSPTVEEAAVAAGISRTTAYRYFKNQAELLAQIYPDNQKASLLPDNAPADPVARLDAVVEKLTALIAESEPHYRTMLRLSLDPSAHREDLVLRKGRAIGWIEDALAPLRDRFTRAQLRRLAISIRSAIGIEARVWLVDVAGQSPDEATKTMRWTARTILRGALAGASP